MIDQDGVLVQLLQLVDRIPTPPPPARRPRGRPIIYPERLFLKALLIMIVRHLHKVGELLAVLEEPTPEMQSVRELLKEGGRFPCRRTFERRLKALPQTLPEQIGCLGRYLVAVLKPWASTGRAVALDSTVLWAKGGVWHKKDRQAGVVPHTSIDTEAGWTKSGWHGRVYGWKLHLTVTVGSVWIPLSARLTPANTADNKVAAALMESLADEVRFVLGDTHYDDDELRKACLKDERFLVTPKRGAYPHTDAGEWRSGGSSICYVTERLRTSTSTSRRSSTYTGRFPPKARRTPHASLLERFLPTSWLCSTATSEGWTPIVDSNPSSEQPDELCPGLG